MLTTERIKEGMDQGKDPRKTKEVEHKEDGLDRNFLAKLRMGVDQWHYVDVKGEGIKEDMIPMRILSIKEVGNIELQALKEYGELLPSQQTFGWLEKRKGILTIKRALSSSPYSEGDYKYFASDETIEHLSIDMLTYLLIKYDEICSKFNLNLDELTEEEYRILSDELSKKPQLANNLSHARLVQMCQRLSQENLSLRANSVMLISPDSIT